MLSTSCPCYHLERKKIFYCQSYFHKLQTPDIIPFIGSIFAHGGGNNSLPRTSKGTG